MDSIIKKYNPADEYYFKEGCFITEVSNSADDPELSIARARVRPAETTRWHSLVATVERYVILEGTGVVEIGHADACEVKTGDVVIIPAQTRQRITNNGESDLLFLALCSPRFKRENYQQE